MKKLKDLLNQIGDFHFQSGKGGNLFYRYRKNFHMLGGSKFRLRQGFNLRPKYLLSVNAPPVRDWLVLLKQNRKQL